MPLSDYLHHFAAENTDTSESADDSQPTQEGFGDSIEEIEYIFFYELPNLDELKRLAKYKEQQEQWAINYVKGELETSIRVRKSARSNTDIKYIFGTKSKLPGFEKAELEKEVPRAWFDEVKSNAKTGMIKDRYVIPIDGTELSWEVDVFYDVDGNFVPWVKVDLEVPSRTTKIPEFPLEYLNAITNQGSAQTEKERRIVRGLFRNHYIAKR